MSATKSEVPFVKFKTTEEYEDKSLQILEYINTYLPEDIAVLSCEAVPERFHSRLSAARKTYRYQIEMSPKKNVFQRDYYYGLGCRLDQKKMEEAAVSYDSIICEKKCPLSLSPLNTKFYRYKEDFDKCEMMDFEFLKIPVPVNYHAILSRTYGDYMKFVIGTSLHGNVFFDTDKSYTEYTNR